MVGNRSMTQLAFWKLQSQLLPTWVLDMLFKSLAVDGDFITKKESHKIIQLLFEKLIHQASGSCWWVAQSKWYSLLLIEKVVLAISPPLNLRSCKIEARPRHLRSGQLLTKGIRLLDDELSLRKSTEKRHFFFSTKTNSALQSLYDGCTTTKLSNCYTWFSIC